MEVDHSSGGHRPGPTEHQRERLMLGGGKPFSRGLGPRSGGLWAGSTQGWDGQDAVVVLDADAVLMEDCPETSLVFKIQKIWTYWTPHPTGQHLRSDPSLAQDGNSLSCPVLSSLCCHLLWHLDYSFSCIKTLSQYTCLSKVGQRKMHWENPVCQ